MDYKLISVADAALDLESMTSAEARAFMLDREHVGAKLVKGKAPTWFHCKDFPFSTWRSYVSLGVSDQDRYTRAFQVGVQSVDALVSQDGKTYSKPLSGTEKMRTPIGEIRIWSDEELDLFAPVVIEDIGSVILQRSNLPLGLERRLLVPPMSLQILGQRARFLADAPATKPHATSSKRSPQKKRARSGGKRTAARVTE